MALSPLDTINGIFSLIFVVFSLLIGLIILSRFFKFKERIYIADNCIYDPCDWALGLKALNIGCNVSMAGIDKDEHRIFFYEARWGGGQLLITKYDEQKY